MPIVTESGWVFGDVPDVAAWIVICDVPSPAVEEALTVIVTATGLPAVGIADAG